MKSVFVNVRYLNCLKLCMCLSVIILVLVLIVGVKKSCCTLTVLQRSMKLELYQFCEYIYRCLVGFLFDLISHNVNTSKCLNS